MLRRGWSAITSRAPLSTATTAEVFSFRRTRTLMIKPGKIDCSYCSCSGGRDGGIRISDPIEMEYADLNLKEFYGDRQIGHVRIRQHVNPLSSSFRVPVQAPDWDDVLKDSKLPLMVDIGSGSGRFLIWHAKRTPDSRNYLGLEIRQKVWKISLLNSLWRTYWKNPLPQYHYSLQNCGLMLAVFVVYSFTYYIFMQLVERCQFWAKELSLRNIHFISSNATVSFEGLVSSYPGPLVFVSILCPDPHFKKRHHKRRVLQKPLVDSILGNLTKGGQVFLQSDVLEVAMDMRSQLDLRADVLKHIDAINGSLSCDDDGWLQHNPIGIRTEREIHAELEGATIYRRLYQKI